MVLTSWILLGLTAGALLMMLLKGRVAERLAAVAFLAAMLLSALFDRVVHDGVRWVVAVISIALFATLAALSLANTRWWLLVAAGAQLVALATHVAAIIDPDLQAWASVSIRYLVWLEMMLLGLFGVWEARCAPYAHPDNRAPA